MERKALKEEEEKIKRGIGSSHGQRRQRQEQLQIKRMQGMQGTSGAQMIKQKKMHTQTTTPILTPTDICTITHYHAVLYLLCSEVSMFNL